MLSSRLGAGSTFGCAGADQVALNIGKPAEGRVRPSPSLAIEGLSVGAYAGIADKAFFGVSFVHILCKS